MSPGHSPTYKDGSRSPHLKPSFVYNHIGNGLGKAGYCIKYAVSCFKAYLRQGSKQKGDNQNSNYGAEWYE